MARIETTDGDVYYTKPNCDCGLTGGCDRCQPILMQRFRNLDLAPPFLVGLVEKGMEDLKAGRYKFYKKT